MINFNLYLQSSYSLNGSLIDIEKAVEKAASFGYKTLGLVDVNHMYGVIKFYQACIKKRIKPIIGLEVSLKGLSFESQPVILYAKNNHGYNNLIKISSFLGNGNADIETDFLKKHNEGIIGVIISDKGMFSDSLYADNDSAATIIYNEISEVLDSLYLGLDLRNYSAEIKITPKLQDYGKAVVLTTTHYLAEEDKVASQILQKILQKDKADSGLFESDDISLHLRQIEEVDRIYSAYPIAIKNTYEIINQCEVVIDFDQLHLPKYQFGKESAGQKLKELTNKGLVRRLKQKNIFTDKYQQYQSRLDYELSVIEQMNYEDYFLIVWDFVLYAKKRGILVGPGRGSAAGSLVAYVLGIVDVDPIEFDLYFERFLNPERITMPDIDMDFPDDKRDEIIQYVADKYGYDKVVSIITFGTFQGKSAIRDVARVLGTANAIIEDITSNISETNNSIEEFQKLYPKKYRQYISNPEINTLISIASKLNGLCRHTSTHAAGVIITEDAIHNYCPTQKGLLGMLQTQYEAEDLEKLGLLKIDFLGIRNLSIITNTLDLIKQFDNKAVEIYKIPLDDDKTFKLLKAVNTLGIFQLESSGMMNLMRQMQISEFNDIATCISLHRPGPMENIPSFIKRRNKEERVSYIDDDLIPILKDTQGIIVYQEQIMKIANKFAGYSLGEADVLRRAVSKKNREILEKEREKFVQGVINTGYSIEVGNQIYDYIVKFANYGFNKSHAVAYSLVAYWMAYLKANYPSYFLSVLLNSQIGSVTGTNKYIMECRKLGIKVLPPRLNLSTDNYGFENGNLRFPYKGIKGIGDVTAKTITNAQYNQPFTSFVDFVSRTSDIGSNVVEALIFANVFESFGFNKRTLINNISSVQNYISFGNKEEFKFAEYPEYDFEFLQQKEKEMLGINFEYHPIHRFKDIIQKNNYPILSEVLETEPRFFKFVAVLSRIKKHITKTNENMAFVTFEDEYNNLEAVLFPKILRSISLEIGLVYLVEGNFEIKNQKQSYIINKIRLLKG